MTKPGDMPVFPYTVHMEGFDRLAYSGLTKREAFAMAALPAIVTGMNGLSAGMRPELLDHVPGAIADATLAIADALLAALEREPEEGK